MGIAMGSVKVVDHEQVSYRVMRPPITTTFLAGTPVEMKARPLQPSVCFSEWWGGSGIRPAGGHQWGAYSQADIVQAGQLYVQVPLAPFAG
jgi:hypothetical protein